MSCRLFIKVRKVNILTNIIFIPKIINSKPIIITHCVMPEGDMEWTNLLTFIT